MMVYGHQPSAADGAYFMQSYLASARHLPEVSSAPAQQPPPLHHHRQQLLPPPPPLRQPPPQLLPAPPKLKFQGVCGDIGGGESMNTGGCCAESDCCEGCEAEDEPMEEQEPDAGGSGFLYSLLTAQDASAVQQCSAFLGGTAEQFPRRSQSVSVPARRGSAVLMPSGAAGGPAAHLAAAGFGLAAVGHHGNPRPSSAPRGLRGPYGGGSAPALTTATEEPLDLSSANVGGMPPLTMGGESILEQQLMLQHQHQQMQRLQQLQRLQQQLMQQSSQQPMLRNMLSSGASYPMPQMSPPQPQQHQQFQTVQLAKKTVPVAQSHISDWLKKGTELVRTNGALFGGLEPSRRAGLLCRAWPRILQLYMLEHNFQFAVSPVAPHEAAGVPADAAAAGHRQLPTLAFAEELQRLIGSAAGMPLDNITYNLLRLAAIFFADSPDSAHLTEVQSEIMKHIYSHLKGMGMAHLHGDAVALLQAISRTDKHMLETLFCSHLLGTSVDEFIRSQLA